MLWSEFRRRALTTSQCTEVLFLLLQLSYFYRTIEVNMQLTTCSSRRRWFDSKSGTIHEARNNLALLLASPGAQPAQRRQCGQGTGSRKAGHDACADESCARSYGFHNDGHSGSWRIALKYLTSSKDPCVELPLSLSSAQWEYFSMISVETPQDDLMKTVSKGC